MEWWCLRGGLGAVILYFVIHLNIQMWRRSEEMQKTSLQCRRSVTSFKMCLVRSSRNPVCLNKAIIPHTHAHAHAHTITVMSKHTTSILPINLGTQLWGYLPLSIRSSQLVLPSCLDFIVSMQHRSQGGGEWRVSGSVLSLLLGTKAIAECLPVNGS